MAVHHAYVFARPSKGTATERVWELADELTRKTGRRARRKQVIDAYVAEGGNANTASTQYYYWSQKFDADKAAVQPAEPALEDFQLRVEPNGRLLIPAEIREAMQVCPDGKVTARLVDGELHLVSPKMALRNLQKMARDLGVDGPGIVDEFIAERRRDAERE